MAKRKRKRNRRRNVQLDARRCGKVPVSTAWMHHPIERPRGQQLEVLYYGRYSSDEQDPRSNDAQIHFCEAFGDAAQITDANIEVITDEEISGERKHRPGIDRVWQGIRERRWHLIICEDASRLYRIEQFCGELIDLAVDQGIRVICVNDMVDTADDAAVWEERLHEALRHHAKHNYFLRKRVKRQLDYLWTIGAAIGPLKPGYKRRPMGAAEDDESDEGPFEDYVDEDHRDHVYKAFEKVANNEAPWVVGQCLYGNKVPRVSNALTDEWPDFAVRAMIRDPKYRGRERRCATYVDKKRTTGEKRQKKNPEENWQWRDMPDQRIVPDELWDAANAALDSRAPGHEPTTGIDHPLYGIPRDSRGPLSTLASCEICDARVHVDGRGGGAYRCGRVRDKKCWNRATALCDDTHASIAASLTDYLKSAEARVDEFLQCANLLLDDPDKLQSRIDALLSRDRGLTEICDRLGAIIEKRKDTPSTLIDRLAKHEKEQLRVRKQLKQLKRRQQNQVLPDMRQLLERIEDVIRRIQPMDRESGSVLRQFVSSIRFVPYLQFGTNKVVLRARIECNLFLLFSYEVRGALQDICADEIENEFPSDTITVNLFEPSTGPKYGLAALALAEQGLGLTAVGKRLGLTKRRADLAIQYGKKLRAAGLDDPFIELTEPPKDASRWKLPEHLRQPGSPKAPGSGKDAA